MSPEQQPAMIAVGTNALQIVRGSPISATRWARLAAATLSFVTAMGPIDEAFSQEHSGGVSLLRRERLKRPLRGPDRRRNESRTFHYVIDGGPQGGLFSVEKRLTPTLAIRTAVEMLKLVRKKNNDKRFSHTSDFVLEVAGMRSRINSGLLSQIGETRWDALSVRELVEAHDAVVDIARCAGDIGSSIGLDTEVVTKVLLEASHIYRTLSADLLLGVRAAGKRAPEGASEAQGRRTSDVQSALAALKKIEANLLSLPEEASAGSFPAAASKLIIRHVGRQAARTKKWLDWENGVVVETASLVEAIGHEDETPHPLSKTPDLEEAIRRADPALADQPLSHSALKKMLLGPLADSKNPELMRALIAVIRELFAGRSIAKIDPTWDLRSFAAPSSWLGRPVTENFFGLRGDHSKGYLDAEEGARLMDFLAETKDYYDPTDEPLNLHLVRGIHRLDTAEGETFVAGNVDLTHALMTHLRLAALGSIFPGKPLEKVLLENH